MLRLCRARGVGRCGFRGANGLLGRLDDEQLLVEADRKPRLPLGAS